MSDLDELDPGGTLEDEGLNARELTMAELKARDERVLELGLEFDSSQAPTTREPGARDDELLEELPETDHHLGRFAGWNAARRPRRIVAGALAIAGVVAVTLFVVHTQRLRYAQLHPLPELEATIAPGTPRDMTIADGHMRVELARDAPAINVLHLPDRDISLARGVAKVQFKVEVSEGKTVRLKQLTGKPGDLRETLTAPDALPMLPD